MKKLRKLTSLLLAAVMMLSMSIAVYADQEYDTGDGGSGSITITNATVDETYAVYQLLDMTYDTSTNSYTYTIESTSEWYNFFSTGDGSSYVDITEVTVSGETVYYVTWKDTVGTTSTEMQAFAAAALDYADVEGISPTGSTTAADTTLKFTGLNYGYYLVTSSLGTLVSLNSTTPDVEVTDKNGTPTVEKSVQEDSTTSYGSSNDAEIGETVNFKIVISSVNGVSNLVLHDVMPAGLTLDTGSFSVSTGSNTNSLASASNYTVKTDGLTDGCTFEISFSDDYTATLGDTDTIVITYSATVNSDAVINGSGNVNTTYVTYGDSGTSTESQTTTYVYDLYVYKYTSSSEGDTPGTALDGAKFVLYYIDGSTKYYAMLDANYKLTDWTQNIDDASELTTDEYGLVHFIGLDNGTYYLLETEAPTGYSLLSSAVEVTISGGTVSSAIKVEDGNGDEVSAVAVWNGTSSAMPTTGGIGTTILYIIGCILVLGAAILLITRRRMNGAAK